MSFDKSSGAPFEQILNTFSSLVVRSKCCEPLSNIERNIYFKWFFIMLMFEFWVVLFGIFDSGNYEIHLPDISGGYVSFPHFPWRGSDFTICFWLKTKHSGFFIEYEVAASIEQNVTLVLGLYFHSRSFEILFGSIRRYQIIFLHCFK